MPATGLPAALGWACCLLLTDSAGSGLRISAAACASRAVPNSSSDLLKGQKQGMQVSVAVASRPLQAFLAAAAVPESAQAVNG